MIHVRRFVTADGRYGGVFHCEKCEDWPEWVVEVWAKPKSMTMAFTQSSAYLHGPIPSRRLYYCDEHLPERAREKYHLELLGR